MAEAREMVQEEEYEGGEVVEERAGPLLIEQLEVLLFYTVCKI